MRRAVLVLLLVVLFVGGAVFIGLATGSLSLSLYEKARAGEVKTPLSNLSSATGPGDISVSAPIPPLTSGYTVFTYDAEGELRGITPVPFDFVPKEDALGKVRDRGKFKASILNAACMSTADGVTNPDPLFRAFCEGKSYLSCQGTIAENFELEGPYDPLVREFCGPYNERQAEKAVYLTATVSNRPETKGGCLLSCVCEGRASAPPKEDDPTEGSCLNRVNCRLLCAL